MRRQYAIAHPDGVAPVISRRHTLLGMIGITGNVLITTMPTNDSGHAGPVTPGVGAIRALQATPVPSVPSMTGLLRPCIDFQSMTVGSAANPLVISTDAGDITFEVPTAASTEIQSTSGLTGLHAGPELRITMEPVEAIVATVLSSNGATEVSALTVDGQPVGAPVTTNPAGGPELIEISGRETAQMIGAVRIIEPAGGNTLLLDLCVEPAGITCLDFRQFPVGTGPNPRVEQGLWFIIYDFTGIPATTSEIWDITNPQPPVVVGSGLNLNYRTDILLPECASVVEVALVQNFSASTPVEGRDASGAVVASGLTPPSEDIEHIVTLQGSGLTQVRITPPQNETVLRGLCYKPC